MIEYNVRENQCNDSHIRISFGEHEECLKYDKGTGVFSVYDPRSNEEVVVCLEDINYMIYALEKLNAIAEGDKWSN